MNTIPVSAKPAGWVVLLAALYTVLPMLSNGSGALPWIALPPALTTLINQAAVIACAWVAGHRFRERRWARGAAWAIGAALWAALLYVTLRYCPGGTS